MTIAERNKMFKSPQWNQWVGLGYVEKYLNKKSQAWRWTLLGMQIPAAARASLADHAAGIQVLNKIPWARAGFDNDGFKKVRETLGDSDDGEHGPE